MNKELIIADTAAEIYSAITQKCQRIEVNTRLLEKPSNLNDILSDANYTPEPSGIFPKTIVYSREGTYLTNNQDSQ